MLDAENERRIDALVAEMSLDEKVSMAAGSGLWFSTGVPRVGVPTYKLSDGPNGVRGEARTASARSAAFPVGVCLAATWNVDLVAEVGEALAEECHTKDVQVLLGPTINLQRAPLAGRNFECFSEDPYLTGALVVSFVRAVQRRGVACCAKHFVCNDSEFERQTISSSVDERTLREVYLAPFERAVKEAGVWSVMSAYNRINGVYASAHKELLGAVLKGEWAFDGVVVSDWGGTYDTVGPAVAGLDLEMPGPARHMGEKLRLAVRNGEVPESDVDDKVRRHLRLLLRTQRLDREGVQEERSIDDPRHRAVIRRVATEGMVLLKNTGVLPFGNVRRLALIGPNAVAPQILGGGSSTVLPHRVVTPLEGLEQGFGAATIEVVRGCLNERYLPLIPGSAVCVPGSDRAGFRVSFFSGSDQSGTPVRVTHPRRSELVWFGGFDPSLSDRFSVRIEATLTPRESGVHRLSLVSAGLSRLYLDGVLVVDNWTSQRPGDAYFGAGSAEAIGEAALDAGRPVELTVEFSRGGVDGESSAVAMAGVRIGFAPPSHVDDLVEARRAAAAADVAVVMVGLNPDWETEGHDRRDLELPGAQVQLIRETVAANPNTVVVINAGSPVCLGGWLDSVPAVLQVWYPGQEMGHALADVLSGRVSPSGRLPVTLPRRLADNPTYLDYPGENGVVRYGEGLFVGHRFYDKRGTAPEFPFGHGLTYSTFGYSRLELLRNGPADDGVTVQVDITNTGACEAAEVVQVYVGAPAPAIRAERELKGFAKVFLQPAEKITVSLRLERRAFAFYDVSRRDWVTATGRHVVSVGASSRDLRLSAEVEVAA